MTPYIKKYNPFKTICNINVYLITNNSKESFYFLNNIESLGNDGSVK